MEVVAVVAGTVLGLALLAAGVLKLAAGPAWPRQAAELGVAAPLARAVPWIEVLLGALLVVPVWRPWPAVAASGLLLAFTVVLVRRLGDADRPPCACFGARRNRPLGSLDIGRNLGLLVLAVIAVLAA